MNLSLSLSLGSQQSGVAPFTDDFNRSTENLEASANWIRIGGAAGDLFIQSNAVVVNTTDAVGAAYVSPDKGRANKYAQARILSSVAASFLAVRVTDANNYLGARWGSSTTLQVYQRVSGTLTLLATFNLTYANTKVVRLEDYGSSFVLKVDGATLTPASGSTTISSGPAASTRTGFIARNGLGSWFDDYEAGAL